jgi:FMN reductase
MTTPFIVGIGGTTKANSATEQALTFALAHAAAAGAETRLLNGPLLAELPIYDPGRMERTDAQREVVETVRRAGGLIIATPAYHAGISGMLKNALDHLEDLRGDSRPYLDRRAVGSIITAYGWQGGGTTLISVRTIIHALRGWPTPIGVTLNTQEQLFDGHGGCLDAKVGSQLELLADQVMEFARRWAAA